MNRGQEIKRTTCPFDSVLQYHEMVYSIYHRIRIFEVF